MILLQNGIQEVSGSIPLISTKKRDSCSRKLHESLPYQCTTEKERMFDPKKQRRAGLLVQRTIADRLFFVAMDVVTCIVNATDMSG